MIRGVLCDLSGVVYVGDRLLPGAQEALLSLRAAGVPLRFVTNVSRMPRWRILDHLSGLGMEVAENDLFTPVIAARAYLLEKQLTPHLLVHPDLQCELADLCGEHADVVLLGDAGHSFTYESLNRAFRILIEGAPLVALGSNRYFREGDGLSLDAGPFVKALEYAADTRARVMGKPSSEFFHSAVASLGLDPAEVVMVGDDVETDVQGALDAGMQAILVRTGQYRDGDAARVADSPVRICDDIGAATDLIL